MGACPAQEPDSLIRVCAPTSVLLEFRDDIAVALLLPRHLLSYNDVVCRISAMLGGICLDRGQANRGQRVSQSRRRIKPAVIVPKKRGGSRNGHRRPAELTRWDDLDLRQPAMALIRALEDELEGGQRLLLLRPDDYTAFARRRSSAVFALLRGSAGATS